MRDTAASRCCLLCVEWAQLALVGLGLPHYFIFTSHPGMPPMHPHQWPPLSSDTMGDAASRCDGQVVAVQPWGLLRGANGHLCLAVRSLDVLDPATTKNRGFERLRCRSQLGSHGGITSFSPIRVHITLVDRDEYQEVTNAQMSAAKAFLDPWTQSEQTFQPGLGPRAVGSVLKWTTQSYNRQGHTECLDVTRVPPARGTLLSTWEGLEPSREYERYVQELQDGLHLLLDNLRVHWGYTRVKQHYHLSLRRVRAGQEYTGRGVWR